MVNWGVLCQGPPQAKDGKKHGLQKSIALGLESVLLE